MIPVTFPDHTGELLSDFEDPPVGEWRRRLTSYRWDVPEHPAALQKAIRWLREVSVSDTVVRVCKRRAEKLEGVREALLRQYNREKKEYDLVRNLREEGCENPREHNISRSTHQDKMKGKTVGLYYCRRCDVEVIMESYWNEKGTLPSL